MQIESHTAPISAYLGPSDTFPNMMMELSSHHFKRDNDIIADVDFFPDLFHIFIDLIFKEGICMLHS